MARSLAVAFAIVASAACATRARPPSPPRQTALRLEVVEFATGNGLRVVVIPDPGAGQITVTMRYRVGAMHDPQGRDGMAHLVEHLMFEHVWEGTTLYDRLDVATTEWNAFTDVDTTTYVQRGPAANLEELLEIEGLRLGLGCRTITDDAFLRERDVVLNELRQRGDASAINAAIHEALFPAGHPYRRTPAGSEATVAAITKDEACAFVDTHYVPGNAVLVVAGNVTEPEVDAALSKMLGRVAKRATPQTTAVAAPRRGGRRADRVAPVDDEAIVMAWPLPADPVDDARVMAVASMIANRINSQVGGSVSMLRLGGDRAAWVAITIDPAADESVAEALAGARDGVDGILQWLADESFEAARQNAHHALFESFEEGYARDTTIADHVLAGRSPSKTIGAQIAALTKLTREDAKVIAASDLTFGRATIITLSPPEAARSSAPAKIGAPMHDAQRRPIAAIRERADRPAPDRMLGHPLAGARTRILANGLRVVLVPTGRVPTVDIRIVFPVGAADEPAGRRGIASLAGHALTFSSGDVRDLLMFYASGGRLGVTVTDDVTVFTARGLDMHVDYFLIALERLIRNGRYNVSVGDVIHRIRDELSDDERASDSVTRAWRTALYGAKHVYVDANLPSTLGNGIEAGALGRWRDDHYRPLGATLIVAGGFDAAIADRWIDHLFGDWSGTPARRNGHHATLSPATITTDDDGLQIEVQVGMPAKRDPAARAAQMVAAEMLELVAADVRAQLGASYGVEAGLVEERLATWYSLRGYIDARRAGDAIDLLAARIAELRAGGGAIAPLFLAARRRVLDREYATSSGASDLAERIEDVVALGRDISFELAAPRAIAAVTLADVAAPLAAFDLSRAVLHLRGPKAATAAAAEAVK
jgi:zinc protease